MSSIAELSMAHGDVLPPGVLIGRLIGNGGIFLTTAHQAVKIHQKWIEPMDSRRQIGLETTSGEVLIVV